MMRTRRIHGEGPRDTVVDREDRNAERRGPQRRTTGTLCVGCTQHLGAQKLQTFLGACYVHAPHLDVEVFHLPSGAQRRRLQRAELDLGLLDACAVDGDRGIEAQLLFPGGALALFLPIYHPFAAHERLEPRALAGQTLLTRPRANLSLIHI